jgi:hypothetical protein
MCRNFIVYKGENGKSEKGEKFRNYNVIIAKKNELCKK